MITGSPCEHCTKFEADGFCRRTITGEGSCRIWLEWFMAAWPAATKSARRALEQRAAAQEKEQDHAED